MTAAEPSAETISRESWIALGAMALAILAVANDFTAMNVVLPTLEQDLDASLSTVQWVVSGYALVFGVLIVTGGRLADLMGRKEVLTAGAAMFAGFSLLGGLAPNIWVLIAARILMGVGGALMWPSILGLMYAILPESKAGLAGGLVIGVAGIGNALGPVIAGALAEVGWRYIFFLNVPVAAIAIAATWRFVHVSGPTEQAPVDYLGSGLISLSLLALLLALTVAPSSGYGDPLVLVGFALSALAMAGFVARQSSAGEGALIPAAVIGNRPFRWACLSVLSMAAIFFATLFYVPQFLQKILSESSITAGLLLLPFVGMFALASFAQTWIVNRIGMKAVISLGACGLFAGPILFLALLRGTGSYLSLVPGMVVLGIGVGLFYSSVTTAALTSVEPSRSSLAGGLLYMFQIAGGAVGLALTTSVFMASSTAQIDDGASEVGVTLSSSELVDIQGVLAGTDTSQALLDDNPNQAAQLTEVVRDAFVSSVRWAFAFDALLAAIGLAIALAAVGGPFSRLGRDIPGHERPPREARERIDHRHPHRHRHAP